MAHIYQTAFVFVLLFRAILLEAAPHPVFYAVMPHATDFPCNCLPPSCCLILLREGIIVVIINDRSTSRLINLRENSKTSHSNWSFRRQTSVRWLTRVSAEQMASDQSVAWATKMYLSTLFTRLTKPMELTELYRYERFKESDPRRTVDLVAS